MTAYGDSSFAVSLFAQDANGEAALNLMRHLETPLLWTEWHDLEFENALELRVFRGEMTRAEQQSCVRSLAEAERGNLENPNRLRLGIGPGARLGGSP